MSEPGDELEKEADRVADHVMRAPASNAMSMPSDADDEDGAGLQRACATCTEEDDIQREAMVEEAEVQTVHRDAVDEEEDMQRACADCDEEQVMRQGDFFDKAPPMPEEEEEAPSTVQTKGRRRRNRQGRAVSREFQARLGHERRGGGEPLPAPLRYFMEARFGDSFDRVRIHRDAASSDLTSAVNARAFTVGRHLFFNRGEFQPHSEQGRRLVAHELTHVLQQRAGMQSVQREVMERDPTEVKQSDERQKAAERISFATIAEVFGWREDVMPPLVFQTLRDLVTQALDIAASRESLAVFALDEPPEEDVRRIVHSPSHELELELEGRGDSATPDSRWQLEFFDRSRIPAKGGQPVTIHTDEDSISVGDTGSPKPVPAPEAVPERSTPAENTTPTSLGEPVAASAAAAGAPEASSLEATPEREAEGPAKEEAPPPEEEFFPASPEEDPSFQAVVASADSAADASTEHGASGDLAANAKDAATVTPGEQLSKAQGNKADQMQAAKTPGFDKAAFVQAVLDKVRETAPHSLPEAANYERAHKAGLTNTVNQAAGVQTDKTAAELKTVTNAAPNTAAVPARPAVALDPETVGEPPADIQAERAVPPERPQSQVEGVISANQAEAKATIDELGFENPDQALANANDPRYSATLEAKKAFEEDAATAPGVYREGEKELRTAAMSDAGALGQQQLGAMVATRTNAITAVAARQQSGKKSSEDKRKEVIEKVHGIFTRTEGDVKEILAELRENVFQTFQTQSERALDTFTGRVEDAEQRWKDKSILDQAAEGIGSIFLGIPTELEADLQAIRNAFIEEMKRIVEDIAATVERELGRAKQRIADGRAELKTFLDGLDPSLGALRDQLSGEFNGKFGTLETEVRKTEQGLVTGLAERFKARLDESDKLLAEVRERNHTFFDTVREKKEEIQDELTGLLEKLQQVFADGFATLMQVLANPVQFAKNFLAGIMLGFKNFASNIGTHLKAGLIEWLTGSLAGAGVTLPETFDLKGIVGFILQLLGLTVENVKARARVIWGEKIVRAIELGVEGVKKAIELFTILQNEGVGGLIAFLKEKFVEFKDLALQKIKEAIALEVVEAAVKKVATLLVPGGAILQAVLSIIDAVFFFIRNADRIATLIQTITSAVKDILAGNVGALAAKVEGALASTIPVVLDFLASLLGIGGAITETIQKALKAITQPIQDAIDAVLLAIKNAIGGLIDKLLGRGGKDPDKAEEVAPGTPMTEQQIIAAVVPLLGQPTVATDPAEALAEKQAQAEELKKKFQPSAPEGKTLNIAFNDRSAEQVDEDREVDMEVGFSPGTPVKAKVPEGVDADLAAAIQQRGILGFLEDMASKENVGPVTFQRFAELWDEKTGDPPELRNREHVKDAFLAVGMAAAGGEGVHEWIPRAEILNVVRRVRGSIDAPQSIANAGDWLQAMHRWRTPTSDVFLDPTHRDSSKQIGGRTVIQGHPGAVWHLEEGKIRPQVAGSAKMHIALQKELQGASLTVPEAKQKILVVIDERIWKGGAVSGASDEHKSAAKENAAFPLADMQAKALAAAATFESTLTTNLE